jgi:hypothetical protein
LCLMGGMTKSHFCNSSMFFYTTLFGGPKTEEVLISDF